MSESNIQKINKANELILAKYSVDSIFENRIIALVLLFIQGGNYTLSENNNLIISFGVKTLQKYCNVSGNNYFQTLADVQAYLRQRWIGYTDYSKKAFKYSALFVDVEFINGVFTVIVNGELKKYLVDITSRGNYTPLSLCTLMSLKSNYSIRLYEILRKSCFSHEKTDEYNYKINVTELKLMLGVYKIDEKDTKLSGELSKGQNADYDYIESLYKDNYYSSFQRFNNKILVKAVKEVNEKSNITVNYEQIKEGRGGKTVALMFTSKFKDNQELDENVVDEIESDNSVTLSKQIFEDLKLSDQEYQAITKASGYNASKLMAAREVFDKNAGQINNPVAWIISALKNDYSPSSAPAKASKSKSSFNNFTSREYDYDALMKDVLK